MKLIKSICISLLTFGSFGLASQAQNLDENSSQFLVDLSARHQAYSCVVDVIDKYPVMMGYPDHTFRGDFFVDRHELLVSLAKMAKLLNARYLLNIGKKLPAGKTVLPVSKQHWSYSYAQTLQEEFGLIFPFEGNYFEKNLYIQRKELALILSDILNRVEQKSNPNTLTRYSRDISRTFPDIAALTSGKIKTKIVKSIDRYQVLGAKKDQLFLGSFPVTRYELATSLCQGFKAIDLMTDRHRLEVKND